MKNKKSSLRSLIIGSGITLILLIILFIVFKTFPKNLAKELDISTGFYLMSSVFLVGLFGLAINAKEFLSKIKELLQIPKYHLLLLGLAVLVIGLFTHSNVEKQHRVLSDETSWESMGLMMEYYHNSGVCNEGFFEDGKLHCTHTVNNFKGKSTPYMYYLMSFFGTQDRDLALKLNFPLFLLSLGLIYLLVLSFRGPPWLALATAVSLGTHIKMVFQSQTATTEGLYVFLFILSTLLFQLSRLIGTKDKHLLLLIPVLGFFSGTRLETVFAYAMFAYLLIPYFKGANWRFPVFTFGTFLACLPAVITIAAYKGYNFQGGKHEAHSLGNLWSNLQDNILMMLNWGPLKNGLLEEPFSSTQAIFLYAGTLILLFSLPFKKDLRRFALPSLLFFLQAVVIMVNVSGSFEIGINQRYVLVCLPFFALLTAYGFHTLGSYLPHKHASTALLILLIGANFGILFYHTPSFNANIQYYRNKLLEEEKFLNAKLKEFPEKATYFYSRPWQMLAQRHNAYSETTLSKWSDAEFDAQLQKSEGHFYIVRGQDGYGKVNRNSKVVGFKTTNTQEKLRNKYQCDEVFKTTKNFGYPLEICRINGLKKHSPFRPQVATTLQMIGDSLFVKIQKQFPESLKVRLKNKRKMEHWTQMDSTYLLSLSRLSPGHHHLEFSFLLPDQDTLSLFENVFIKAPSVKALHKVDLISHKQGWGSLKINQSVLGKPLQIAGHPFKEGFGGHAPGELVFKIPQGAKELHFGYGLDDDESCGDGVRYEVWAEGKALWKSPQAFPLEFKQASVPLPPVKEITIRTLEIDNKSCDHADVVSPWVQM